MPGTLLSSLSILYHEILITVVLIRTVVIFTDEEPEAKIRQLDLSHIASSAEPGLSPGLSTCKLYHLPPTQVLSHSLSPNVGLDIPACARGWSGTTFPRARSTCFKREHSLSKGRDLGLNLYFYQSIKLACSKSPLSNSSFLTGECGWASGSP